MSLMGGFILSLVSSENDASRSALLGTGIFIPIN